MKKQQADAPDGRRPTEPGEDQAAHDGLDLKQQKGAEKDRYGENSPVHSLQTLAQGQSANFRGRQLIYQLKRGVLHLDIEILQLSHEIGVTQIS